MFPNDFLKYIDLVFKNEGIYSNNPYDPGEETFAGISRKYFPNWSGWKIIDTFNKNSLQTWTKENIPNNLLNLIMDFYYNNFYLKLRLNEMPEDIRLFLFDTAINIGRRNTIKILQKALKITDDGIIGPNTLKAINSANINILKCNLKIERIHYYVSICYKNKNLERFLLGWINRVLTLD